MGAVAICLAIPAVALASSSQVWVSGNCTKEQYKPHTLVLSCADGDALLKHLTWSHWSGSKAAGSGIYSANDCKPSCAGGHFKNYPATVALSQPKACPGQKHKVFTHADVMAKRKKDRKHVTKSWTLFCPIK